jgi:nitroreductase
LESRAVTSLLLLLCLAIVSSMSFSSRDGRLMVKPSKLVSPKPRMRAPNDRNADDDFSGDGKSGDGDSTGPARSAFQTAVEGQIAMLDVFKKRHSVRSFQARKPGSDQLREILDAADSAPSAGGLKAREVFVVTDEETKKQLVRAALGQEFIAEAPVVLVFWAVESRSAAKYGERGRALFSVQDATIAASFAWLQAVGSGLGACWVGAFDDDAVRNIFRKDIKRGWRPIALMPIGYPAGAT